MIEIGNDRTFVTATRRFGSLLGTAGAFLLLIWLVRQPLQLSGYSYDLLVSSIGIGFVGRLLRVRTGQGPARAISSLMTTIAVGIIIVIIEVWFLGWIASLQGDVLPVTLSNLVPNLVVVAIATGLAAYIAYEAAPRKYGPFVRGPALHVSPSATLSLGDVELSPKEDTIVLPIRKSWRTIGGVVFGDLTATFETPMGKVTGKIPGPVTTLGVPIRGERADRDTVQRLTGKNLGQLLKETNVDSSLPRGEIFAPGFRGNQFVGDGLDLPLLNVRKGPGGSTVDLGPISISRSGESDDDVEVGPFSFSPCDWDQMQKERGPWFREDKSGRRDAQGRKVRFAHWLAKGGRGSSYLSASPEGVQARWNGSALRLKGDSMKMAVGSDGFVYTPTDLETYSPLHMLHVGSEKAALNTKKFTLNVSGSRVLFRSEAGSRSTESPTLAKDLRDLLVQTADRQVKSVIEGEPMELDDMLAGTEELLRKYE